MLYKALASHLARAHLECRQGAHLIGYVPQQRDGERGALCRVRARPHLVEQHERIRPRAIQNRADPSNVPRKCREILLQRLRVADVREHGREDGDLRAQAVWEVMV